MVSASVAAGSVISKQKKKEVPENSFEDKLHAAYGTKQRDPNAPPGGKLQLKGAPPPTPIEQQTFMFKYRAFMAEVFLTMEIEEYSTTAYYISLIVKLFICFAILATGVRALECLFNSECRAFVHGTRLVFLAICISRKIRAAF